MKRLLTLMLTICLIVGILPVTARGETLETIDVGEARTLTLEHMEEQQILFSPDESGEYIFYMRNGSSGIDEDSGEWYELEVCSLYLEDGTATSLGEEFRHQVYRGIYCQLQAGETYTLRAVNDQSYETAISGTVYLIRSEPAQSINISGELEYAGTQVVGAEIYAYIDATPAVPSERSIVWESSDESVFTVSTANPFACLVECVGVGTATLTAKTENGVSDSVTIVVEAIDNTCGDNATWSYDESTATLTISGEGAMYDVDYTTYTAPWRRLGYWISHVVIEEGITHIGDCSFLDNSIESIEIPNSVTSIGRAAFPMYGLTSVEISENVTEIGWCAFRGPVKVSVSEDNPNYSSDANGSLYTKDKTVLLHVSSTVQGQFTIPETVHTIEEQAFINCREITEIDIPETVKVICSNAFGYCSALTEVNIPASVESLENSAFDGCSNLTGIWVDENNPNYASDEKGVLFTKDMTLLIAAPGGITGTYEIPLSATTIQYSAFRQCRKLTEVVLHEKITEISAFAFDLCTALTKISIPASVETIDVGAFFRCSGLEEITFEGDAPTFANDIFYDVTATAYYPAGNATWTEDVMLDYGGTITWVAYEVPAEVVAEGTCGDNLTWVLTDDGVLTISGEGAMTDYLYTVTNAPWYSKRAQIQSVVVKEGVTSLGDYAFYGCDSLAEIALPESLESIGDVALASTVLTVVNIPAAVTSIGGEVFEGISELTAINVSEENAVYSSDENGVLFNKDKTQLLRCPLSYAGAYVIPDTVQVVGHKAFDHCTALTQVTVPGSVTELSRHAFFACTGLKSVILAEGLQEIGDEVFSLCSALSGSLTIPSTLTTLGDAAFDMTELTEIRFLGDMPAIGEFAFSGIALTVYYPADNETWTAEKIEACKGISTWAPYGISIVEQPQNAQAQLNKLAKTTVEATGEGLTYTWYVKDVGGSFVKSSIKTAIYSYVMTEAKAGRQVYCVVTDEEGNSVTTRTVTFGLAATLVKQPQDVSVAEGEIATVSFDAVGDGLTYKWYFKNADASKFLYTSTFSGDTYTATMNDTRNGRQIYCVITDQYGNSVQTNTVTLSMTGGLKITRQPESVTVAEGGTVKIDFAVAGEGLTYKWYFKNAGASKFTYTSTFSGNTYTTTMNDARNGRQVYCVVTDKYGNTVKTNTVTMTMASVLKITRQPESVTVAEGGTVTIDFAVSGDGLTYKWYFKNAGASKFTYTSTFSGNSYTTTMNDVRNGRQIYCVITDQYGNSVQTNTVTMRMSE